MVITYLKSEISWTGDLGWRGGWQPFRGSNSYITETTDLDNGSIMSYSRGQ